MIQSRHSFNIEDSAKASKLSYKNQTKRKELFINIAIPIGVLLMVGILIYDLLKDKSIIFDIVLLVLLVVVEIMNLVMPFVVYKGQKRYLSKLKQLDMDYCISEYDKGIFKEKFYKNKQMVYLNEINADKFAGFIIEEEKLFVFFSNYQFLIFYLKEMEEEQKINLKNLVNKLNILPKPKKK